MLRFARRYALLLLSGLVLLTVPVMLACLLSGRSMLAGFDGDNREMNSQIADLLKGEQLAAPAPLPPAVFSTAEVVLVRPMLDGANRNWQRLDAELSQRLLLVFKIMKETHGYDMAFQSFHQFGLAADCAFMRDGKLLISEKDPWAMRGYRLYGELAEAAGLHWGGRWTMMDFGHVELRQAGAVKK
jgi:peptidoglycan L-alanyl-D-glutamate endopeptidase CwlK